MRVYPVFLDLTDRTCLVVGGGRVGRARIRGLVEAGARVTVVDPEPSQELLEIAQAEPRVAVCARRFSAADVDGVALVFACTADPAVNGEVMAAAAKLRAPASCAGREPESDRETAAGDALTFRNGAVLRRGDVCIGVSTGGDSPVLAAAVRDRLANELGPELGEAASMLGDVRRQAETLGRGARAKRAAARHAIDGGLLELLAAGRRREAEALCRDALERAAGPAKDLDECIR